MRILIELLGGLVLSCLIVAGGYAVSKIFRFVPLQRTPSIKYESETPSASTLKPKATSATSDRRSRKK